MRQDHEDIAYAQGGLLRRDQVLRTGQTPGTFRRWRSSGRWRQVRRSVYVDGMAAALIQDDEINAHVQAINAAALRLCGNAVASFESAAVVWGIDILGRRGGVHLTRPRRGQGSVRKYPGIVVHHAALPPEHRAFARGAPVTSVARTVMDIARTRAFRAGVVAADAVLRERLCDRADLRAVVKACRRWPGNRKASRVAEFADPRSESPLESISRAAFHEHDLPSPEPQVWITPYERVDFLWSAERVIGEADGMGKYATLDDVRREKERQELLERLGYRVVRWTWQEVFRRPDAVAEWVRMALAARG
ncbi:MAG: DUF559 domain-containing protein [Micromonosporaceae bacterium]